MKKLLILSTLLLCLTASNKTFSAQEETKYRWVEFREGLEHPEGAPEFSYLAIVQDGITLDQINAKIEDLLKLMNHKDPVINCLILHSKTSLLGYLDEQDFKNKETDTLITLNKVMELFMATSSNLPKSVFILRIKGNDIETFSFKEPYDINNIEKKLQDLSKADNSNTKQTTTHSSNSSSTNIQKEEGDSLNASTTSNSSNVKQDDNNNTSNKTNKSPLIVVGLILVGAVVAAGFVFMLKKPKSSKDSNKKSTI